jgi:hypothetical protein
MILLVSGEGKSDIGTMDFSQFIPGPMTYMADQWIERKFGYSLIESKAVRFIAKPELSEIAKSFKKTSKTGKKSKKETRYFYQNARALSHKANKLNEEEQTDIIAILFRDADGTASADRGEWGVKHQSILKGFEKEGYQNGVPMLPKPKSEAWILCALKNKYLNCSGLENSSGNDKSPNALKTQLEAMHGHFPSAEELSDWVKDGIIDINQIDMPSLNAFKNRCDYVVNELLKKPFKNKKTPN